MALYINTDAILVCSFGNECIHTEPVFLFLLLWTLALYALALQLFAPSCFDLRVIRICVLLQPVTCGTWAQWKWSPWRASRQYRKPPVWLWAPTLHQPPPWSTSKFRPRESPSPTTRGSKYQTHFYTIHTCNDPLLTITMILSVFRLFFRRHYNVNTVIFCALDPQDRKWVLLT